MWTYEELSQTELKTMARLECECVTSTRAGTRHGFTCQAHRAQAELDKRESTLTSLASRALQSQENFR